MSRKLKLFVLYHCQQYLNNTPDIEHAQKINLTKLKTPHRSNMLGEGRAFLDDLDTEGAEYIGVINARWNHKYTHQFAYKLKTTFTDIPNHALEAIDIGTLSKTSVIAPWTTDAPILNLNNNWYDFTLGIHPTMSRLLSELVSVTKFDPRNGRRSFWANDFICHRLVYLEFVKYWRRIFAHFHGRYGYLLPMSSWGIDTCRAPAYFYERVSTLYWANRLDLTVVPIP